MEKPWLEQVKSVIKASVELAKAGQTENALTGLDAVLAEAPQEDESGCTRILCRHAAALAHAKGDLQREIQYTRHALPYTKDYPFAAYHLAQLLLRDGHLQLAEKYATEAYELTISGAGEADADLALAIIKQWPNIAASR